MPVAVVQTKTATISTSNATHPVTFNANVTPGSWVVIFWRQGTANRTPGIPVPSAGTWSGVQDFLASNGTTSGRVYCWSAQHTGTATDTYTITLAGSNAGTGVIQAFELSGVDATGTPRGAGGTQFTGTSGTSWNVVPSPGVTLTSGDIILGAAAENLSGWGTLTAPSGFTTAFSANTGPATSAWIGHNLTTGTITGPFTISTSRAVYTGYQIYLQSGGGGTSISVSDSGSGADGTPVVACSLTATESGAGTDATPAISCSLMQSEAGAGEDGTPAIACSASQTETSVGTDGTPGITCSTAQSETGTGTDATPGIACGLSQTDTGAGTDGAPACAVSLSMLESSQASDFLGTLNVLLAAITDSAAGTDVIVQIQQGILIALGDSGLGSDALTSLACSLATADASSGTDAISCSVLLQQMLDACTGADVVASSVLISVPDSGAGSDSPVCTVQLSLSDTASGMDLLTALAVVLGVADQAGGSDTISINTGGGGSSGRVATITFTARGKSAAFSPDSKSTTFTPNL